MCVEKKTTVTEIYYEDIWNYENFPYLSLSISCVLFSKITFTRIIYLDAPVADDRVVAFREVSIPISADAIKIRQVS